MVRRNLEDIKIPYSRVINGRRYWEPSKKLTKLGFTAEKLGKESPTARRRAKDLTAKAERALEEPKVAIAGTLTHYWINYRGVLQKRVQVGKIKPRTAEEYDTAWTKIKPRFGSVDIADITVDDVEDFYFELEEQYTPKVRHRAIAKLSSILRDAVTRRVIPTNPCDAIRNIKPAPRNQFFYPFEIDQLIKGADSLGMHSMAICIRLIYETARSPADARLTPIECFAQDASGPYVMRPREKTGAESAQKISASLMSDIQGYMESLGVTPLPDQPFLRQHKPKKGTRHCVPWVDESDFAKDFAKVRRHVFGQDEQRRAMDIRRTANLEAELGGAKPEERAAMLANNLDKSVSLDQTYTPPTLAAARKAAQSRELGQGLLNQMGNSLTENSVSNKKSTERKKVVK